MPSAWRLTKTKYLSTVCDGEDARKSGGRWNSVGAAVVYASGSLSLALVEVLVHLPSGVLPAYSAIRLDFDDSLVTEVAPGGLPTNWRVHPAPVETRTIGDTWRADRTSVALRVPSVVVPSESNFVLNPSHPDFGRVVKGTPAPFPFDPRLRLR